LLILFRIARDEPFQPINVLGAKHREAQLAAPNESGYLCAGANRR
jgi:hypothetical protein